MNRVDVERQLKTHSGLFYVYQLARPDGTPFYIGKGTGRRLFHHEIEARGPGRSHKLNTIRLLQREGQEIHYSVVAFFDCEIECHAFEVSEIKRIGRFDLKTGLLTNLTAGGEGTVGLSEETRERIDFNLHSADAPGERGIANRFYLEFCTGVRSVPVRPLNQIAKPRALTSFTTTDRKPSVRQAAALAASAIANRVLLEPQAIVPRRLQVQECPLIMEFGVCKDLIESGLAELEGGERGHERLRVTAFGYKAICDLLDTRILISAGVLSPEVRERAAGAVGDYGSRGREGRRRRGAVL